jgi:nitrate/nitrite transporter NarK
LAGATGRYKHRYFGGALYLAWDRHANPATPFWIFILIALLCGFAGANFASSMGNISFFFPKAKQGSALGVNGGLATSASA